LAAATGPTAWGSDIGLFTSLRKPSGLLFQQIYGESVLDSGIEFGLTIYRGLEFRLEISAVYKEGLSIPLEDRTSFFLLTPYAGLRYAPQVVKNIRPYIGGGVCYAYYLESTKLGEAKDWVRGYRFEGGIRINLIRHVNIDLNISKIVLSAKAEDEEIDLGGLRYAFMLCHGF